jgi:ABC-type transport system involved in multi-copper enzyme maturation permease subunit
MAGPAQRLQVPELERGSPAGDLDDVIDLELAGAAATVARLAGVAIASQHDRAGGIPEESAVEAPPAPIAAVQRSGRGERPEAFDATPHPSCLELATGPDRPPGDEVRDHAPGAGRGLVRVRGVALHEAPNPRAEKEFAFHANSSAARPDRLYSTDVAASNPMTRPMLGDVAQFRIALLTQFRFYLRTYRFLALLGLTIALGVLGLGLQLHYGPGAATPAGYLTNLFGLLALLLIVVAAFLGGDAIAVDFGGANGYFVLVLPVRRRVLLVGRYLAALGASAIVYAAFIAFSVAGAAHFYGVGALPPSLGASLALGLLFLVASVAGAFMFSSLFRSPAISMIATVLILFLGLDIAQGILIVTGVEPWFSLLYAGQAISAVLDPNFAHQATLNAGTLHLVTWTPYPSEGAAIMLGYFALGLALSWLVYERKELVV